ncbi:Glycosyltransferase, GT2 family [Poseidonocella pacifica]|uniref:Glycosyltransferase, GT2 family n=1 Tax=Poseidonocella pacifica TaxID=871651 RepID=A0A1I0X6K9_9RHOB|nr:glycosyltransferase [Poseidonocella pacifica]SFA96000.1 Glycosyltransferase, GT2 family [Poseidonocella pacifica]
MKRISALTIAAGRETHLANVIEGFSRQDLLPDELIIGVMQDSPYEDLPAAPFPVRQISLGGRDLNLSAARNAVAEAATGDLLAFVDVDCIPAPSFLADYANVTDEAQGILMGEVSYLPKGAADNGVDYPLFDEVGEKHSDRAAPPKNPYAACEDYRCFWSLNFAIGRAAWEAIGGFDERYVGYGGEDTDFGRTAEARDVPIWWVRGARVYHQHHAHCMPPIHHVASVVRNAEVFASKWGHRTMEHWLYAFQLMGLIESNETGIRILREPNEADFALCRQTDAPYANTRRVLDILQGIDREGTSNATRTAEVDAAQTRLTHIAAE